MKIYMIRHGATKGNREHRYVGCTDESVLPEEKRKLAATRQKWKEQGKLQVVSALYVSPMKRCRETAEILYPGIPQTITEDFRECNFGEFEYRNFEELNGNPDYQRFIDTFGEVGFPGGETKREFQKRCADRMEELLTGMADMKQDRKENGGEKAEQEAVIALVVHGGTIMAILDAFSDPHRDYYEWQTGTGKGFCANAKRDAAGAWHFTDIHEI